jgi:hypothetical protein
MSARPAPRRTPSAPEHPWVLRIIVAVAIVVLVGGILWATLLGHLF